MPSSSCRSLRRSLRLADDRGAHPELERIEARSFGYLLADMLEWIGTCRSSSSSSSSEADGGGYEALVRHFQARFSTKIFSVWLLILPVSAGSCAQPAGQCLRSCLEVGSTKHVWVGGTKHVWVGSTKHVWVGYQACMQWPLSV